jgi:glutathione S-transferase
MADYTLHCFVESGNAYKTALMLELAGCDWQPLWIDFFKGATRTPEYRAINEMGEVPVLIDHTEGDLAMSQSGVILYHLAGKTGKFKPETPAEEREVLRWILWDNHKLTSYIATYRFLRMFAGKDGSPEAEFLKGRAMAALKVFESHLANRDWVASDRPTIADFSCCGYLFWPSDFGVDWKDYPAIGRWLERIKNIDNWAPPEALLPSGPAA